MRFCLPILFTAFFAACQQDHPGYKKVDDGLYLKLLAFDDVGESPDSCYVYELQYAVSDSLLHVRLQHKTQDNLPLWLMSGDERLSVLQKYLLHLQPGDSAVFIDESQQSAEETKVALWWKNCYSREEFVSVYEEWLRDRELREGHRIRLFALDNGYSSSIVQPEVLYRTEKSGSGNRLKYGNEISIRYSGHFLTGSTFDSLEENEEPLVFVLGEEGQVLTGLEYGLIGARPGEIRSIIIPSFFAFGEKGSSTGIVPPYTPVRFKVHISDADMLIESR